MNARTIVLVSIVAVVLVALTVVTGLRGEDANPSPNPQPTLAGGDVILLQVTAADGYAVDNALLTASEAPTDPAGAVSFVPASLLVPVSPDDSLAEATLGRTAQLPDTLDAVAGIEGALDVRVDAGLTLDRLALAGLVDAVDGVPVEVPEETALEIDDSVIVVPPGEVRMGGLLAAEYATARLPGDSEDARERRFAAVLLPLLVRLPDTPERMRQVLTSLGSLAVSTLPTDALVPPLVGLGEAARAAALTVTSVPTLTVRDGARPASVPAPDAAAALAAFPPRVEAGDQAVDSGVTG